MLSRTTWRFTKSWLTATCQQGAVQRPTTSCLCRQLQTLCRNTMVAHPCSRRPARQLSSAVGNPLAQSRVPFIPRSGAAVRGRRTPVSRCGNVLLVGGLHTSAPRRAVPPLLILLLVKPIAKLTAMLSGRAFRQWWKALPHNKRQYFYQTLRDKRYKILGGAVAVTGVGAVYYYSHLQVTPITNRRRFIALTETQFQKIAATEYEKMKSLHADACVHSSHPLYLTIGRIVLRITQANQDIPQVRNRTWTIHIIDKDVKNAFVLPNGEIFVFTGILKAVSNEEQLGTVLAHEIAHVVLNHAAEQVSFFEFVDLLLIVVLAAIWALLPSDGLAVVATWFKGKVVQLLLEMPYSRSLEAEADEVGLILSAKSCFDVRESKAFWETMALQSSVGDKDLDIEWLSTHPTNQSRADTLGSLMPQALELRRLCNCPPLPSTDPSSLVKKQRQIVTEERERRKSVPVTLSGISITS